MRRICIGLYRDVEVRERGRSREDESLVGSVDINGVRGRVRRGDVDRRGDFWEMCRLCVCF